MKNLILGFILFTFSIVVLLFLGRNVNVDSNLFPIRRLDEYLLLETKFNNSDKQKYYNYLILRYFLDIKYVIGKGRTDLLLSTSLRYSTIVGKAVGRSLDSNLGKNDLKKELEQERIELKILLDRYIYKDNRQKYIEDSINYVNIYLKKLDK